MTGMNRNLFRMNNGILTVANGNEEIVNFDFEGRVLFYTREGVLHRRSTDNSLYKLQWDGDLRVVEPVDADEAMKIYGRCYNLAREFPSETLSDEEKEILTRIASRDTGWLRNDSERMLSHYKRPPFMPPDQSSAIYLELSSGCKWNRCSICASYAGREFGEKSAEEFLEHVRAIRDQLGAGLSSRRGIFLGDASALDVDQKTILRVLDELKKMFDAPIFTAFDIFNTPKRKNMIHYRDLKAHGLERIFVFLESGSYKVIRLFNTKINVTETLNLVNNIKDYGIAISVVVMVGMGGTKYSSDHVGGTANIISQMNLTEDDMIFLSPVVEEDDQAYMDIVQRESAGIMDPEQKLVQMEQLTKAIRENYLDMNGKEIPVKIVRYDLRESIF